jgi:protein-tyrosine phosphatase
MLLDGRPQAPAAERAFTEQRAAALLEEGGLVAVPTDTVYGIAVRGDRPEQVQRLYRLKRRPLDRSMTIHLPDGSPGTVARHAPPLRGVAARLARALWPGALTLVVPDHGGQLVGLRVPDHELLRGILHRVSAPVLIPSANRTGDPPASSAEAVQACFGDGLDAVVDGGILPPREASTVVLARPDSWEVLRPGAIAATRIDELALVRILLCCTGNTCRSPMAEVLLRDHLQRVTGHEDLHQLGLHLSSAGLAASAGHPASDGAIKAVATRGLSLALHESRLLTDDAIRQASLILVMTAAQRRAILERVPDANVELLRLDHQDVADPYQAGDAVYANLCSELAAAVAIRVPAILRAAGLGAVS